MKNDKKTDDKIKEKKDDKKSDDKGEEKKGKLEKVADGLKSTEKIVDAGGSVITKVIGFVDGIIHRDEKKKKDEEQTEQIQSLKDEIEKLREQIVNQNKEKEDKKKEEEEKKQNKIKGMNEWKEREKEIIDSFLKKLDFKLIEKMLDIKKEEEDDIKNKLSTILIPDIKNEKIIQDKYTSIFKGIKDNIPVIKTLNFLVAGYTGCGKSTLTNAILQDELAKEGHSINPGISTFEQYSNPKKVPGITIFDTIGIEAISADRNLEQIKNEIKKTFEENLTNPDKSLHGILYCIKNGASDTRIEPGEIKFIKELNKLYGDGDILIIVFTRSTNSNSEDRKAQLKNALDNDKIEIIEVLARDSKVKIGKKEFPIEAFGLDELIMTMKNKCNSQLGKHNIKQIIKKIIQDQYLSDIENIYQEILKKIKNYEFEKTFIDECKYILKSLIGDLNLNFEDLDNTISKLIKEEDNDIKENILKNNRDTWLIKLYKGYQVINYKYNGQLENKSIEANLIERFNEYYETKISDYIKKIIFFKASTLLIEELKKFIAQIISENMKDKDIEEISKSNVEKILSKIKIPEPNKEQK